MGRKFEKTNWGDSSNLDSGNYTFFDYELMFNTLGFRFKIELTPTKIWYDDTGLTTEQKTAIETYISNNA